ncbi:MAG: hypothetical protein WBY66_14945 [Candidatus Acidiferrales bacterium]
MVAQLHFVPVAAWLVLGIFGLLWMMACGITAGKMEKEGIAFWRGFFACLLLTPLVGLAAILIARITRPKQRLAAETVSRG